MATEFPRRWMYHVNIKPFLGPGEVTPQIGLSVVRELKHAKPFNRDDWDVLCMLEELQDAADARDTEWFNLVLANVYDYADSERVWLGVR